MTETILCVLCLLLGLVAVGIFLYLGRSCGAQKGQKLSIAMDSYSRAKTWDQKLVFFAFNAILLLKGGFWGFLTLFSAGVLHVTFVVCGHNPWPYYFEAWDRFVSFFGKRSSSGEPSTASIQR